MKEFVVFYAWQSDRLERFNRHLIRIALNMAAKAISEDPVIGTQVRIDADTEGVLGHVPITATILNKIAACDAFVPDLTFVAEAEFGKLVPNPNVMLEYGYALHAKSHSVMIPVMNAAYGPADQLPFDMRHLRHPLKYNLPLTATNAQRREVRKTLTEQFEAILRLMVEQRMSQPSKETTPFREAKRAELSFLYFRRDEVLATFGRPGEQAYRFDGNSAIYLRLFPQFGDGQPHVGRARLKELVFHGGTLNPMTLASNGIYSSNDYGWIAIDPTSRNTTRGLSQAFTTGELWGVHSQVFRQFSISHGATPVPESALALAVIGAERLFTRTLHRYISFAISEIKLNVPFIVEFGAVGLRNVYLGAPHREFGQYDYGPIRDASMVRRYTLRDVSHPTLWMCF
jgi:hypothetical protein